MRHIYLDFNAKTPLAPSVQEAMEPFWIQNFHLPTQGCALAAVTREALGQARERVAGLIQCPAQQIVFTSGATEANNLATLGCAWASAMRPGRILLSPLEADSVLRAAEWLGRFGWSTELLPCQSDGTVDPEHVRRRLDEEVRLVCVAAACPVTGTIQPVREIAEICHAREVRLHCDATVAAGRMPIDAASLGADTIAISGDQIYGPPGAGALYVRPGLLLEPCLHGEPGEANFRPSFSDIPGAVGLGAAARLALRAQNEATATMRDLCERFIDRLESLLPEEVCRLGGAERLPNTIAFALRGAQATAFLKRLPELTLGASQMAHPPDQFARAAQAAGIDAALLPGVIRVSTGWTSNREEVELAADWIAEVLQTSP